MIHVCKFLSVRRNPLKIRKIPLEDDDFPVMISFLRPFCFSETGSVPCDATADPEVV